MFNNIITTLFIGVEVCIQKIGEEKQFENGKHDEKLDKDDDPQPFADRAEVPEAVVVEVKDPGKDVSLQNFDFVYPKIVKQNNQMPDC